jgi:hypothetical protein
MFSCASEGDSRDLLGKLEQFRATVLKFFPLRQDREPRATVVLFETDRQFAPYKPLYDGQPKNVAGYFVGFPDEAVIALTNERDLEATMETIFHEYVHLLLEARGDRPPPWLNEGLAEAFSTFRTKGDTFEVGRTKPAHLMLLSQASLLPLQQLFAVTRESPEYNEGRRQGIFYAESWAFVHFVVFGKDRAAYGPKLARFLVLSAAPGAMLERGFREAFEMNYDDMEGKLRDYLRGGRYGIASGKLERSDLLARITFQPADDFERNVALINLRWRIQQLGNTAYELRQLAAAHPQSPRPHEVLAAVAMREQDVGEAFHQWQQAADLGSDNAFVYVQLANERLRQMMVGLSLDYRMPADSAAALRGWLDRAITLSPDYLEAYDALAMVEALAEKPRIDVVNRVQQAVPRMRDKARGLFAIAVVHWRLQDFGTSRRIVEALRAESQTPSQIRRLAQQLDQRLPPAASAAAGPEPAPTR